jgi:hypothetical protein
MAGNSGKMTNEAIAARGPRMVLARVGANGQAYRGLVIYRERECPIKVPFSVLAKSYSLSYLLKVGRGNQ